MTDIFITTENPSLTIEEPVTGTVRVSLSEAKSNVTALCLRVLGQEIHDHQEGTAQRGGKQYLSTKTFLDFVFPLESFTPEHSTMAPGKYDYPFQFHLPKGIPASLKLASPSTNETFFISYSLSAYFLPQPQPETIHKVELWVNPSVSTRQGNPAIQIPKWHEFSSPREVSFTSLWCCSSGCIRLATQIPRVIVAGRPFDLFYSIFHGTSNVEVEAEFSLWAELKVKTRSTNTANDRLKLFKTKRITAHQLRLSKESAHPASSVRGEDVVPITDEAILKEMKRSLNHPENLLRIVLPEKYTFPSSVIVFGGKGLREVQYYVSFELFAGEKSIHVETPITLIHAKPPQASPTAGGTLLPAHLLSPTPSAVPPDWQATVSKEMQKLSTPTFMEPVLTFSTTDLNNSSTSNNGNNTTITAVPTTVSPPVPEMTYEGFPDLIYFLKLAYDQPQFFRSWTMHSPANQQEIEEASPLDFTLLFQTIRSSVDQLLIAEFLIAIKTEITIDHLVAAMQAANKEVKVSLAQLLASRCKPMVSELADIKALCTPYEYLCVEEYFIRDASNTTGAKISGPGKKTLLSSSYDTVPSKDEAEVLVIGAESTEDGLKILKNRQSWSVSRSEDFDDHLEQMMDSQSMAVSRM